MLEGLTGKKTMLAGEDLLLPPSSYNDLSTPPIYPGGTCVQKNMSLKMCPKTNSNK
jgi:hypothetical protein